MRRRERRGPGRSAVLVAALVLAAGAAAVWSQLRDPAGAAREDACAPPYSADSPWNTPIEASPPRWRAMPPLEEPITSDPTQFTYPVHEVSAATPRQPVRVSGRFSDVSDGGRRLSIADGATVRLPLPAGVEPSAGTDAQVVLVDPDTGEEWGAWQLRREDGGWVASGAYRYNLRWRGVPPRDPAGLPFGSRGAGVPYLAGLVRRCEIAGGRIEHALAFAYDAPTAGWVYPATKSDGLSRDPADVPEGTRIQLDPELEGSDLAARGCEGACLILARALQRYGAYVVDNSGRPKLLVEYEGTAGWGRLLDESTASAIPVDALRVVPPPGPGA